MVNFITRMIEKEANISPEQGEFKYRTYFTYVSTYDEYRSAVDTKLREEGYGYVIVS